MSKRSQACVAVLLWVAALGACAEAPDREAMVRALIERSRFLDDACFRVPFSLWYQYIRETLEPGAGPPAPVAMIAEEGSYRLVVPADRKPVAEATVRLRVFDPRRCRAVPVLSAAWAWEDVRVDGQPAELPTVKGWLCLTPAQAGEHAVTARFALKEATADGGRFRSGIPRTVRTLVVFDSPEGWEVTGEGAPQRIPGVAGQATRGQLALLPTAQLDVAYGRPRVAYERPPRYELSGVIAWNLDAGRQQVAADLDVAILVGMTDRIDLVLPASAERVTITGPDVREIHVAAGEAQVFLRGRIGEHTRLRLAYDMPLAAGSVQELGALSARDGHWTGGTLVVTNTAGGSEVLAENLSGLRQIALADIPEAAAAILAGAPALACEIEGRSWAASVDVVNLGEFALRESIADLAHYELAFLDDGTMMCKASYEIRNRARQFLRLDLPRGSRVLLARVNEKSRPLTRVEGEPDAWLLPLERSLASVEGLVSFPVEVVLLCRTDALERRGQAELALPRIDLPVAYAWCEAWVPEGMRVRRWAGPLKRVERYSNETATASLGYGRGLAAEGYQPKARPVPTEAFKPDGKPAPPAKKEPEKPRISKGSFLGGFFGARAAAKQAPTVPEEVPPPEATEPPAVQPQPPATTPQPAPETPPSLEPSPKPSPKPEPQPQVTVEAGYALSLGKNYYRAGRDLYERGDLDTAARNLEQAVQLNPKSADAENARRLLSNISLAQGKLTLKSQAEKAAGAQVKQQMWQANKPLEMQQEALVEKGLELAKAGRVAEARTRLEAAESLGKQLVAQGAEQREQTARLRSASGTLANLREIERTKAGELRQKVEGLKESGRYEEALKSAQELRKYAPTDKSDEDKLRTELEDLTILATQKQALVRQHDKLVKELEALPAREREKALAATGGGTSFDLYLSDDKARSGEKPEDLSELKHRVDQLQKVVSGRRAQQQAKDQIQPLRHLEENLEQAQPGQAAAPVFHGTPKLPTPATPERRTETARVPSGPRPQGDTESRWGETPPLQPPSNGPALVPRERFEGVRGRQPSTSLRTYDVTDLAIEHRDTSGRLGENYFGTESDEDKEKDRLVGQSLADYIKKTIAPGTWSTEEQHGANFIHAEGDKLVIQATPDVQQDISRAVDGWRRSQRGGPGGGGARAGVVARTYDARGIVTGSGDEAKKLETTIDALVADTNGDFDPSQAGHAVTYRNGRIAVVGTPEAQKQVALFFTKLEAARGPQVQLGANIAQQEAAGTIQITGGTLAGNLTDQSGQVTNGGAFQSFVARNYSWQQGGQAGGQAAGLPISGFRYSGAALEGGQVNELATKLAYNLGQKVDVNSINLGLPGQAANGLGIGFTQGRNGLSYAVIDEAQFRTLVELDARQKARRVAANPRFQETIVGTDALFANGMVSNVAFAGEADNKLNIADNPISLPHDDYILIDNGGYLTAVRAGAMRYWTEAPAAIQFAPVPQDVSVPRVGRLVKLEKTLVEPGDDLVLQATYSWKGESR